MELGEFSVLDLMIRAIIMLGVIFMGLSNFGVIKANRKENEKRTLLKYYKNYYVQNFPLFSAYIASILLGLGLFRVGSLLKITMSSTPIMKIFDVVLLTAEQTTAYKSFIFGISFVAAIFFVASCILYNLSIVQLGKNFSLFVDIKEHANLVTDRLFGIVRHPIYLFEILLYLTASIALLSWVLMLWVLIVHIPLIILKASYEDKILEHYFGEKHVIYSKKVSGFVPVIKWKK